MVAGVVMLIVQYQSHPAGSPSTDAKLLVLATVLLLPGAMATGVATATASGEAATTPNCHCH